MKLFQSYYHLFPFLFHITFTYFTSTQSRISAFSSFIPFFSSYIIFSTIHFTIHVSISIHLSLPSLRIIQSFLSLICLPYLHHFIPVEPLHTLRLLLTLNIIEQRSYSVSTYKLEHFMLNIYLVHSRILLI